MLQSMRQKIGQIFLKNTWIMGKRILSSPFFLPFPHHFIIIKNYIISNTIIFIILLLCHSCSKLFWLNLSNLNLLMLYNIYPNFTYYWIWTVDYVNPTVMWWWGMIRKDDDERNPTLKYGLEYLQPLSCWGQMNDRDKWPKIHIFSRDK